MTKYFRVALTTALLAGFAVPSFAQTAPVGEMAPAQQDAAKPATTQPDTTKPDTTKPDTTKLGATVKKARPVHRHHVAAKPATAPSK